MPRGVQLSVLVNDLKREARLSLNAAHGIAYNDVLKGTLRRTQEELYVQHDWPFLRARKTIALTAGTRYYSYPAGMTFDTINSVHVNDASTWLPIEYGIEPIHLTEWNSDLGERSSPPRRWQHYATGVAATDNQLEVWPIPDNNVYSLMFTGKLALRPLIVDADTCTLDSTLIVLYAAAELLADQKSEKAGLILQKAQAHFRMLKSAQGAKKQEPFVMGGGRSASQPRIGIDYIPRGYGKGP